MKDIDQKIEEYRERNIRWSDAALNQLSFYNNLLLTLSVGFLSFSFDKCSFKGIRLSFEAVSWSHTFLVWSVILIAISIMLGLFVAINRLQDFRVSRQITLSRFRMRKYLNEPLDEDTPDEFNSWRRLTLAFHSYPKIKIEEYKTCKTNEESDELKKKEKEKAIKNIKFKFRELRNIAHNLGRTTWKLTVGQTTCFAISILFYVMSISTI